jgi:hypothetical protein
LESSLGEIQKQQEAFLAQLQARHHTIDPLCDYALLISGEIVAGNQVDNIGVLKGMEMLHPGVVSTCYRMNHDESSFSRAEHVRM